ncbi:hypothetical protein pb186bvf_001940 [Paramecium bursaria]
MISIFSLKLLTKKTFYLRFQIFTTQQTQEQQIIDQRYIIRQFQTEYYSKQNDNQVKFERNTIRIMQCWFYIILSVLISSTNTPT